MRWSRSIRGRRARPVAAWASANRRSIEIAERFGIPVFTPKSLKGEAEQAAFAALDADAAVVVAYGLILPQAVLDAPREGCLNLHASLLPRWRGAAPIHRADHGRRCRDRRHGDANGSGSRHRPGGDGRAARDRRPTRRLAICMTDWRGSAPI